MTNKRKPNVMPDARKDEYSPWPGWKPDTGGTGPSRGRSDRPHRADKLGEGSDLTAHDQVDDIPHPKPQPQDRRRGDDD